MPTERVWARARSTLLPVGPTMPRLISSHKLSEVSAPTHPTAGVEVVLGLPRHATARTRVHSRVGRRAGASDHIFEDRFRWWREGQRGRLVHLWRAERDRALERRHARAPRGAEDPQVRQARCLARAKTLVEDGELSRVCRLLHDTGMAPLTPGVVDQLRRKHPPRRTPMPAELPGVFSRVTISLTETFRKLRRRRGTGPSGMRNDYLRALVAHFDDPRANQMARLTWEQAAGGMVRTARSTRGNTGTRAGPNGAIGRITYRLDPRVGRSAHCTGKPRGSGWDSGRTKLPNPRAPPMPSDAD